MISEIVLNKKYKVLGKEYKRTPLAIHNGWVFYEHNCYALPHCDCCRVEIFKTDVEEIPEAPEEWFEVIYKIKGEKTRPSSSSPLFKSKEDFLNFCDRKEEEFEFIKLRKVEL